MLFRNTWCDTWQEKMDLKITELCRTMFNECNPAWIAKIAI
jgi:hypothetical protein